MVTLHALFAADIAADVLSAYVDFDAIQQGNLGRGAASDLLGRFPAGATLRSCTMRIMNDTCLYNLSGRAIPANAAISISGEPSAGAVLVIESCDGLTGSACWRTQAELKTRREQATSRPPVHHLP